MSERRPDIQASGAIDEAGSARKYHGLMATFVKTISAVSCLFFLLFLSGVFAQFRIFFLPLQYNAIFMAFVLTLTFLLTPGGKKSPRNRPTWYDIVLLVGSVAGAVYVAINALDISYYGRMAATPVEMVLGFLTVFALIEAVRRSFGWAMVAVSLVFILYAKFGYLLSGALQIYYFSWSDIFATFFISVQGVFGSMTSISSSVIVAFITFGAFFIAAGGGEFFTDVALATVGSMRGGPAKAAVVGSALFGTVSGSGVANVVVTGTFTIPLMKRTGFPAYYAGTVEAISSSGGMIMPPVMGAVAFVMAQLLAIPYSKVATLAALPAILYYISIYVQVDFQAAKMGLRGLPRQELPSLKATLKKGWEFSIPVLVLIFLLFFLKYEAVTAALYTIGALILVSLLRKAHRITFKKFVDSLDEGMRGTLAVANIISLAGVILAVLTVTGLGPKLSSALVSIFGSSIPLLITAAGLAVYIMGMGISMLASYVLVASLVAPALHGLGLPLVVSHFFILYMVTSTMFTPPYAPAAFVAAAIAKANPFKVGFKAMQLGIVCFLVPFIIVFDPALILIGNPLHVAIAAVTAVIGIIGVGAAIEGYLFHRTNLLQRLLLGIGGVLMVIPDITTSLIGLGLLAVAGFWQWSTRKRIPVSAAKPLPVEPHDAGGDTL